METASHSSITNFLTFETKDIETDILEQYKVQTFISVMTQKYFKEKHSYLLVNIYRSQKSELQFEELSKHVSNRLLDVIFHFFHSFLGTNHQPNGNGTGKDEKFCRSQY